MDLPIEQYKKYLNKSVSRRSKLRYLSMISYDPSFKHNGLASPNNLFESLVFGLPLLVKKELR